MAKQAGIDKEKLHDLVSHHLRVMYPLINSSCIRYRQHRRAVHLLRLDIKRLGECSHPLCEELRSDLQAEMEYYMEELVILHQQVNDLVSSLLVIDTSYDNHAGVKTLDIFDTTHTYRVSRLIALEKMSAKSRIESLEFMLLQMEEQEYQEAVQQRALELSTARALKEKRLDAKRGRKKKSSFNPKNPAHPRHLEWLMSLEENVEKPTEE